MSVINQMLKDLEQRTPEQGATPSVVPVSHKPSTMKIVLISLLILLSLNALGFYIWDLQARVASSEQKVQEHKQQAIATPVLAASSQVTLQPVTEQESLVKTPDSINKPEQTTNVESTLQIKNVEAAEKVMTTELTTKISPTVAKAPMSKVASEPTQATQPTQTRASEQANKVVNVPEQTKQVNNNNTGNVKSSSMTVSRRQLTTAELVTQKLAKAEKAVNTNQITKAESLFEEVLILAPGNKQARKKLAALWFGRKSYQQAINLLSQGIAIDNQDSEFRMLKARIQLQQGHHKGAYHTLKPLFELEQQDYQVMLANVAQQIEAYPSAITAYQLLISMQPYSGKWHLGLAIVYDKDSQFTLAAKAYSMALSKNDLSKASAEFAEQRMQALGE